MQKFHNLLESLVDAEGCRFFAIKSFDSTLGSLIAFIGQSLGVRVIQRSYQEFLLDDDNSLDAGLLFEQSRLFIVEHSGAPAKDQDLQKIISFINSSDRIVFISSSNFSSKVYQSWSKGTFYDIDKTTWATLQKLLCPTKTLLAYPEQTPTVEKTIEYLRYLELDLDPDLIGDNLALSPVSWLIFEKLMQHRTANTLTFKQLFQVLNQLETIYLWVHSPEEKKENFYIPFAIKKQLLRHSKTYLLKTQHYYLMFLEAMVEFDYDKARFFLSAWTQCLCEKLTSDK